MTRTALQVAVAACLCLALGSGPAASAYPDKPIRLIVSFPPGGSSDAVARILQPGVERLLGQPIVIENRAGAGGMIAIDMIAKAAPDGYTIGLGGAGALGTNLGLQGKMSYDPQKDVAPVTGLSASPFILAAAPSFQGQSLRDVIALAKSSGDKLAIGHGGSGTLMHSDGRNVQPDGRHQGGPGAVPRHRAGRDRSRRQPCGAWHHRSAVRHVGDRGRQDQNGGHHLGQTLCPAARDPDLCRVRAARASSSTGWFGIVVPAGTPADVIAKLNSAFVTVLKDPDVVERIRALGAEPIPMTAAEFAAFIRSEIDKWLKVVRGGRHQSELILLETRRRSVAPEVSCQ